MGDKVIMIRKYGFKFPAKVARDREKTALQNLRTLRSAKMVNLEIGARCDEVSAILRKLMLGRVRLGHGIRVMDQAPGNNDFRFEVGCSKAAEHRRTPKRGRSWQQILDTLRFGACSAAFRHPQKAMQGRVALQKDLVRNFLFIRIIRESVV
jgi:hypothetical protein